jgi:hypothetical protein
VKSEHGLGNDEHRVMTKSLWQIEDTDRLDELSGFVTHFLRGRGRLLDQGSVPLRHIVRSPMT